MMSWTIAYCTQCREQMGFSEIWEGRVTNQKTGKPWKEKWFPSQIAPSLTVVDSFVNKSSMHAAALIATFFLVLHGKCGREEHELCWSLRYEGGIPEKTGYWDSSGTFWSFSS